MFVVKEFVNKVPSERCGKIDANGNIIKTYSQRVGPHTLNPGQLVVKKKIKANKQKKFDFISLYIPITTAGSFRGQQISLNQ